jgi:hypothetical protein
MEPRDPFIEFVKALARRQARLDAAPKQPANENLPKDEQARQK